MVFTTSIREKSILLLLGFAFASELALRLYKKYKQNSGKKQLNIDSSNGLVAETLFFTEKAAECRLHMNYNEPCQLSTCPLAHLNKIIAYISTATRTLDICVYFLTCSSIVRAIIDLHRTRNIIVRVITDDESSGNEASQIFYMRKAGLRVRSRKSQYLMHHKFVIVDRKLLITGSANWTIQAFFGNCENIIITNQSEIVNGFMNEFEKLWLKFSTEFSEKKENGPRWTTTV